MKVLAPLAALLCVAAARPGTRLRRPRAVDGVSPDVASYIQSAVSQAGLIAFVTPDQNDQVTEWNGLGDSFASGIGSDGSAEKDESSQACQRFRRAYSAQTNDKSDEWSGDKGSRKFTLIGCSGDQMQQIREQQIATEPTTLGSGSPGGSKVYPGFGKPQLSVLTVAGNDVGFGNVLTNCILGVNFLDSQCDSALVATAAKIGGDDLLKEYADTLIAVVKAGQTAGGANPPEKYQLFVNAYVPFWNEVDTGCDETRWSLLGVSRGRPLTADFRKQLNDLTLQLNSRLQAVVEEVAKNNVGVAYVDGWQTAFDGHKFCDPAADTDFASPISPNTWFWHYNSPDDKGEGPTDETVDANAFGNALAAALFPDEGTRNAVINSETPWDESPIFNSYEDFNAAILALADSTDPAINGLPGSWSRIFHPKGTALGIEADANAALIRNARVGVGETGGGVALTCRSGDTINKDDVVAAVQSIKDEGDNADLNNCCSGSIAPACGPLLAQSGSAVISLCGAASKCLGCEQLGSILDGVVSSCFSGSTTLIGGANTTIPGVDGLQVRISLASA